MKFGLEELCRHIVSIRVGQAFKNGLAEAAAV